MNNVRLISGLLCLIAVVPCVIAAPNLVRNSGFEDHKNAWQRIPSGEIDNGVSLHLDADNKHTGLFSAKITTHSPSNAAWTQSINVEPKCVYEVAGWIKSEDVIAATEPTSHAAVGVRIDIENSLVGSKTLSGTSDWTPIQFFIKTGVHQHQLLLACRLGNANAACSGTAWFDDISFREGTAGKFDSILPASAAQGLERVIVGFLFGCVGLGVILWIVWAIWKTCLYPPPTKNSGKHFREN